MWSERKRAGDRERERVRGRVWGGVLWEFWGNSEKVVFCSGETLNKPIAVRGTLPRVRSLNPHLSETAPPCCARFATQPKAELLWLQRRQKNRRRGGRERGRGSTCREWGAERHRSVSFTDRRTIIDHTSSVIKSTIEPGCGHFGPRERKTEPQLRRRAKKFFLTWQKKRMWSPAYQNNGKFLLQFGGVRHGHLQGHDVMFHLGLAVHAFYVSHLQLEEKKNFTILQLTFSSRKTGKSKLPNNPTVWLAHESRGQLRFWQCRNLALEFPKCHLRLTTRPDLQFHCSLAFKKFQKEQ